MKNLASLNPEQMKEFFLVTLLEVEHINVTIKDSRRLLNVLMLLLMSLFQLQKGKYKQQMKMMVMYIFMHQIEIIQKVNPMKLQKNIYLKRLHPGMFKRIIQNLKYWEKRDQVSKQEEPLQDLLAIWHFYQRLNHRMSIKLTKMNVGFKL